MNGSSSPIVLADPFADTTVLHPVMAILIVMLCLAVLLVPRKYAIVPFIIALNCIPFGERIYVLGMNFTAMRIITIVALARIILRNETVRLKITSLDRIVALYAVVMIVTYFLQVGTVSSIMTAAGASLDKFWAYVVVRFLVRDLDDMRTLVWSFAVLSLLICLLMLYESRSGLNSFRTFGGVNVSLIVRGGRIRVQGPYPHPILAGALWASILPLVIAYRFRRDRRIGLMYLSIFCIVATVYFTASSTPAMSVAVAILGSVLYYQRDAVSAIAITVAAVLIALAIFWWHPIWFLFTKLNVTGDSASYFRYLLVDGFVRHWRDWFLIGTTDAHNFGSGLGLYGVGLADLTNQFVAVGANGGFLALALFVGAIGVGFRYVKRLIWFAEDNDQRRAYCAIGVSLLVHLSNFMGVDYFGQVIFSWWMTLAVCISLYANALLTKGSTTVYAVSGDGHRHLEGLT